MNSSEDNNFINESAAVPDTIFKLDDYYTNIKKLKPLWYSAIERESGNPCIIYTDKKLGDTAKWGYVEIEDGELIGLNVNEKYQRQGIATQLIKYAVDLYGAMKLRVDPKNKPAFNLYTKLGFQPTGTLDEHKLQPMTLNEDDNYKPGNRKKEPMVDGEGTLDETGADAAYMRNHGVLDESVTPNVLYHGSPHKLSILKARSSPWFDGTVLYATSSYEFALAYAGNIWSDIEINQSTYNGQYMLTEILPGQFDKTFNRIGYVYHLRPDTFNPVTRSEYISETDVRPIKTDIIPNVLDELEKRGTVLYRFPKLPPFIKDRMEYLRKYTSKYGRDIDEIIRMYLRNPTAAITKAKQPLSESSYNYKDLSDVKPIDREEKERIAEKYGLADSDKNSTSNKTDKPDTPEDRVERLRKQRADTLKKVRTIKKRKRFIRTIKSHIPGVKNESLQSYVEGTEVDDSDLAHYDTDGIDNDPLYGTRRHFFPELGYPKEESVTINEGGLKYLISNGVQDLAFVATRPNTNMLYTGEYDPIKPHLLKMVDSAKTIDRLDYLRTDARMAVNFLTKLAQNMEDYQNGTQSRYVSAQDMEKRFKKGNTPQKTRAYISWLKTTYIPYMNRRAKELRVSLRECIESYRFNIQDKSFRFLDRMNESTEDDGKLYPVYILLMHSGTVLSTAIKAVTQSNFSHSSISFDSSMHNMYSFGRKADVNPFVGGFKKEDIRNPFFQNREIPYALYMVPCTKGEITMMKKRLDFFIKNSTKFHYDFTGLFKNYLGIADNPEYKWFCSRFVADILNAGRPSDDPYVTEPSLMKPEDFRFTNFAQYVSGGFMSTYDSKFVDKITTRLLRIEKLKRKKQDIMDKEMAIVETGYDVDYLNPYAETVLNYQLTVMDESVVDSFFTYLKSFKLRFDKEGNIIITRREYDQLDSHFKSSQKMIKACEKAGNIEGVKEELSKIYYMIHLINDQYLSNKTASKSDVVKKDMIDLRSVMMNVFQQHLGYVTKLDPKFNFQSYYDGSKYGKDTTIPKATVSAIGKTIVTLLS